MKTIHVFSTETLNVWCIIYENKGESKYILNIQHLKVILSRV
jgi:hypothetical protein